MAYADPHLVRLLAPPRRRRADAGWSAGGAARLDDRCATHRGTDHELPGMAMRANGT